MEYGLAGIIQSFYSTENEIRFKPVLTSEVMVSESQETSFSLYTASCPWQEELTMAPVPMGIYQLSVMW